LTLDSRNTLEEYKMVIGQLQEAREGANYEEEATLLPWKKDLETAMQDIRKRKREYEEEPREHLNTKPAQLQALYEQVGYFSASASAMISTNDTRSCNNRPPGVVAASNNMTSNENASALTNLNNDDGNENGNDLEEEDHENNNTTQEKEDDDENDEDDDDDSTNTEDLSRASQKIRRVAKKAKKTLDPRRSTRVRK